jgi:hypothetical protein
MVSNGEWKRIAFPFAPKIVYVVKIRKEGEFRPIYVGMSETRNIGPIKRSGAKRREISRLHRPTLSDKAGIFDRRSEG